MFKLSRKEIKSKEIIKEIEKRSNEVFAFKEGTLYPILHTFEKDGYLTSYWFESENGRKRKYYHITEKGIKLLSKSREEWESYSTAVKNVLSIKNATT